MLKWIWHFYLESISFIGWLLLGWAATNPVLAFVVSLPFLIFLVPTLIYLDWKGSGDYKY